MKITIKGLKSKNENLKKKRKLAREFADPVTMSAGAAVAAGAGLLFLGGLVYWIFNKLFGRASQQLKTSMDKVDQAMLEVLNSPPKKDQDQGAAPVEKEPQEPVAKQPKNKGPKEKTDVAAAPAPVPAANNAAANNAAVDNTTVDSAAANNAAVDNTTVDDEAPAPRVGEEQPPDPAKVPFYEKYEKMKEKIKKQQEEIAEKSKDPKKAAELVKLPEELIGDLFNEIAQLKNEMVAAKDIFTEDEINTLKTGVDKALEESKQYLKQFNRYVLIYSTKPQIKDSLYNTLNKKGVLPPELEDPNNWQEFSSIINDRLEVKNA